MCWGPQECEGVQSEIGRLKGALKGARAEVRALFSCVVLRDQEAAFGRYNHAVAAVSVPVPVPVMSKSEISQGNKPAVAGVDRQAISKLGLDAQQVPPSRFHRLAGWPILQVGRSNCSHLANRD